MFDRVWKKQIQRQGQKQANRPGPQSQTVRPKGKLGIWKPKSELRPREEEKDDKCCEEARAKALHFHKQWLQEYTLIWVEEKTCDELYDYLQEYIDNKWPESTKTQLRIFGSAIKKILEDWDACKLIKDTLQDVRGDNV
jgi:hypothetical protein